MGARRSAAAADAVEAVVCQLGAAQAEAIEVFDVACALEFIKAALRELESEYRRRGALATLEDFKRMRQYGEASESHIAAAEAREL